MVFGGIWYVHLLVIPDFAGVKPANIGGFPLVYHITSKNGWFTNQCFTSMALRENFVTQSLNGVIDCSTTGSAR